MMDLSRFDFTVAVLIGIVSVARTARLVVHDDFPPVVRLRIWWDDHVHGGWNKLLHCQFCITPYMAAANFAWFWYSDAHWSWWLANGLWAASYAAAIVVAYDQPPE